MWKYVLSGVIALAIVLAGFSLIDFNGGGDVGATAQLLDAPTDIQGYARAFEPYDWQFPADFVSTLKQLVLIRILQNWYAFRFHINRMKHGVYCCQPITMKPNQLLKNSERFSKMKL